jgi:natural product biosynthesis luciferase-like monooxygenase protein
MRFSLFLLPCYRDGFSASWDAFYDEILADATFADQAGWTRAYVSEHHFHYYGGAVPNPAMMLLAIAGRTRTLRLASGISLLPLHDPLKVAEDYAMLDRLSGGRLDFGVGRGYLPHEFAGFNQTLADQQARFDESFAVIRQAWTGQAFAHQGAHFRFDRLAILPTPRQSPVPVMVAGSRTRETFEWAGRNGFDLMMNRYPLTDEQMTTCLGWYRAALAAAGHDMAQRTVMVSHMTHIADTDEQAMAEAKLPLQEHMNCFVQLKQNNVFYTDFVGSAGLWDQPGTPEADARTFIMNRTLVGSPARVAEQIERYRTMGFNEIAFITRFGALSGAQSQRTLQRLQQEVRPLLGGRRQAA